MTMRFIKLAIFAVLLSLTAVTFGYLDTGTTNAADCTIQGQVYRDFNANGIDDGNLEPGIPGITVTAYDAAGNFTALVTGADGSYTFTPGDLAGLTAGEVRVEFTGLPEYLSPGPSINNANGGVGGGDSTVIFVDCSGAGTVPNISTALNNPADYCDPNPTIGTVCYVFGNQQADATAFVTFPYESGTTALGDNLGVDTPAYVPEANDTDLGSVWGMAYQRTTDNVFLGAFMKRHVGFREANDRATGSIYRIDRSSGAITEFLNLNDLFGAGTTGANPHPFPNNQGNPSFEEDNGIGWDGVGKISFGDLQMAEDQRTLYAVNLADRSLYTIPIGTNDPVNPYGPVAPGAGQIGVFPMNPSTLPGLPCANTWDTDLRPGALGTEDGLVYVGVLCSAESTVTDHTDPAVTGDLTQLEALVYAFDGANFTLVANFGLDYNRGRISPGAPAEWLPWKNQVNLRTTAFATQAVYPQPFFMDVDFDELGFMVVGIADRFGHQSGTDKAAGPATAGTVEGVSGGDILRLAPNGATWVLENNGTSGGITTGGANNGQGPGNGEYYFHDRYTVLGGATHDETTLGGLATIPGRGELVVSAFDPAPDDGLVSGQNPFRSGGVIYFDHATGQRSRSYLIYPFDATFTFGKAAGIGDMEVFCGPAPIEIGNIVWEDLDRNGQQDPNEAKIANVTVNLYIDTTGDGSAETLLANTVTGGNGEYYFNEATILDDVAGALIPGLHFYDVNNNGIREAREPAGVLPFTTYRVALDAATNYNGGPLTDYYATPNDTTVIAQNADIRDSDGIITVDPNQFVSITNFTQVTLTTGAFGDNDHTFDFGFSIDPPDDIPTPTPIPTETPPPTETPVPTGDVPLPPTSTPDDPDTPFGTPGTPGTPANPFGTPVAPGSPVAPGTGIIVTKIAEPPFAAPGDRVDWIVTITNPTGNSVAVGEVIDDVPDEMRVIDAESTIGTAVVDGQVVTVTIADLPPGESAVITIRTRIRSTVTLPFVITNVVGNAAANVISAARLPDTGE